MMKHTYIIEGMTCQGCVAKVKSKLLSQPDILSVEVSSDLTKADISMQRHLQVDQLQRAIGDDSKYRIKADDTATHTMNANMDKSGQAERGWLRTYKPLLIIGIFILVVSLITSSGSLHIGMNHFMAGFFLVFSFFKLLDIKGFAESYSSYDILAMKFPLYGYVYPFMELALGLAFLSGFEPLLINWITIGLMGFSSIGVIRSVLNKEKIRCACLGAVFDLPMSTVTIVEDLLMVAMAGGMIVFYHA
jgi:copper chaperone CopZ